MALALHLSVRRYCNQCQHHRCNREGLHRRSPWHSAAKPTQPDHDKQGIVMAAYINLLFSRFSNF
jgi:hypothetical protein